MRAYLWTTGTVFALLTITHVVIATMEWPARARDPWFLVTTIVSAALFVWAWRLTRVVGRDSR